MLMAKLMMKTKQKLRVHPEKDLYVELLWTVANHLTSIVPLEFSPPYSQEEARNSRGRQGRRPWGSRGRFVGIGSGRKSRYVAREGQFVDITKDTFTVKNSRIWSTKSVQNQALNISRMRTPGLVGNISIFFKRNSTTNDHYKTFTC